MGKENARLTQTITHSTCINVFALVSLPWALNVAFTHRLSLPKPGSSQTSCETSGKALLNPPGPRFRNP